MNSIPYYGYLNICILPDCYLFRIQPNEESSNKTNSFAYRLESVEVLAPKRLYFPQNLMPRCEAVLYLLWRFLHRQIRVKIYRIIILGLKLAPPGKR